MNLTNSALWIIFDVIFLPPNNVVGDIATVVAVDGVFAVVAVAVLVVVCVGRLLFCI